MNQPRGIDVKAPRKVVIKWIIDRRHAFNEVGAESFRNIIAAINKAAVNKLPHSGNTILADILRYFKEAKPLIAELLSTARSRIHLSFDLYTSPNCKALLAITAHWTSAEYKAEATLLAIRELKEEHTGENIAQWIHIVVKEYGVMDKLGYFVMDNAGNRLGKRALGQYEFFACSIHIMLLSLRSMHDVRYMYRSFVNPSARLPSLNTTSFSLQA